MSRNKKQSTKAAAARKTSQEAASQAEQIKDSLQNVQASLKDSIDTVSGDKAAKDSKQSVESPAEKAIGKTNEKTNNSPNEKPAKASGQTTKADAQKPVKKPVEDNKKTQSASQAASQTTDTPPDVTEKKASQLAQQVPTSQSSLSPEPVPAVKKSGGLALLALFLGVAGTGLGAYSFNELRTLKAANSSTDYTAKLTAIESQLKTLESLDADATQQQLTELLSQVKSLKAAETGFNERMAKVEQGQSGAVKNITSSVEQQLAVMGETVKAVQGEIDEVKLGQQGLAKNISSVTAGSESVSDSGMAKQEIGYLLRMADYKLVSERDVLGAAGLLQIAADRLLADNQGQTDTLVDAIRAKTIQLQGVKMTDENALVSQLGQVARDIPLLVVKSSAPASATAAVNAPAATEKTTDSVFDKLTSAITSGIKYTPKDPNQIDISAETILIEKRLLQADVKTAEFAIRSHNKTLLSESFRSIRDTLDKSFADDDNAKGIKQALTAIEQSELSVVLPSLSDVIKQFEQTQ